MTPQKTDSDLPVSVQESLAEVWVGSGLFRVGGTEYSSVCVGPFEEGCHYLLSPPYFGLRSNNREGTQSRPSTENWIKDLLSISEVIQSCLTLCHPMDSSLPGSSVHGIFQTTILECAAISLEQDPVSPSVSLSHQESSISLLSFSIRGQTG